jgi:hypothetical protein
MKHLFIASLAVILTANPAVTKPNADWAAFEHSSKISISSDIQVRTIEGKSFRGRFMAADDEALRMTTANGDERLPRASVTEVSVAKHGARWKHALAGLAIGAAVGLAVGAIADSRCRSFCFGLGAPFGAGVGLIGGAGIGAALPTSGWSVIYRRLQQR